MSTRMRTVLTIIAATAVVALVAGVALLGYQGLSSPPIVISHVPLNSAAPEAATLVAPPAAATESESESESAPAPTTKDLSGSASTKKGHTSRRSGSHGKRSGKVDKLKSPADGQVDINTADASELQRLPGIGPAMAQRIIDARKSYGGFRTTNDLMEVRGIGQKKFAKIEPFVKT
jgi:competence protein ComEA